MKANNPLHPKHPMYPLIMEACDRIAQKGESPSAQKVINILGKGSMRDIQAGITEWRTLLDSRMNYYSQYPDLPQEVVDVASKLMKVANASANQALLDDRQKMDVEVNELRESCETALAGERQSMLELKEALSKIAANESRIANLTHQLEKEAEKLKSKTEELITVTGELNKSNAIVEEVRANLKTTLVEKSDRERKSEIELLKLGEELSASQKDYLTTNDLLKLSLVESEKLQLDVGSLQELNDQLGPLRNEVSAHKDTITLMTSKLNESINKSDQLNSELHHQAETFEMQSKIKDLELEKAVGITEVLKEKLGSSEIKINSLNSKVESLQNRLNNLQME